MTRYRVLCVLLAAVWAGCTLPTVPPVHNAYQYAAYDTAGTLLVRGWFTMNVVDSTVKGVWHFAAVGDAKHIGPQTGDGTLVGIVNTGSVQINLNPNYVDNNVELSGTITGKRFSGTWTWISFIGVTNRGPFDAAQP